MRDALTSQFVPTAGYSASQGFYSWLFEVVFSIIDEYGYVKRDSEVDYPTVLLVKEYIQNLKYEQGKRDTEKLYQQMRDLKT